MDGKADYQAIDWGALISRAVMDIVKSSEEDLRKNLRKRKNFDVVGKIVKMFLSSRYNNLPAIMNNEDMEVLHQALLQKKPEDPKNAQEWKKLSNVNDILAHLQLQGYLKAKYFHTYVKLLRETTVPEQPPLPVEKLETFNKILSEIKDPFDKDKNFEYLKTVLFLGFCSGITIKKHLLQLTKLKIQDYSVSLGLINIKVKNMIPATYCLSWEGQVFLNNAILCEPKMEELSPLLPEQFKGRYFPDFFNKFQASKGIKKSNRILLKEWLAQTSISKFGQVPAFISVLQRRGYRCTPFTLPIFEELTLGVEPLQRPEHEKFIRFGFKKSSGNEPPEELITLYNEFEELRIGLGKSENRSSKEHLRKDFEHLSEKIRNGSKKNCHQAGWFQNLEAACMTAVKYLEDRKLQPSTIERNLNPIPNAILPALGNKAINNISSQELSTIFEPLSEYYNNSKVIQTLKIFYMVANHDNEMPTWKHVGKQKSKRDVYPFLMPYQFDSVWNSLGNSSEDLMTRTCLILSYWLGLRVGEATLLERKHVTNKIEPGTIRIMEKTTKTFNGQRLLPYSWLIPEPYLTFFEEIVAGKGQSEQKFIVPMPADMNRKKANKVSAKIAGRLKYFTGQTFRKHDLRHCFANHFLLRWYAVFHGAQGCEDFVIWKHSSFNEVNLATFKKVFGGLNPSSANARSRAINYPLIILGRLLGHGSPKMSLESYIHILPLIGSMMERKKASQEEIKINKVKMGLFLNTNRKLLSSEENLMAEKKSISQLDLLKCQQYRILTNHNQENISILYCHATGDTKK